MKVGAIFPQTEIGTDLGEIRAFVQAVEEQGYDSIFIADHVLGADPQFHQHPSLARYSYKSVVHEPLTLMAYMAAITTKISLSTGILILPQRQTALVAKQAAEIDVLSGGRMRLGIGVGWNEVEYEALGEDFHNRGSRCTEQIEVMRALWTQDVVTFEGKYHTLNHVAIEPRPSRPIPIWIGGMSETAMKRAIRLGDGWFPQFRPEAPDPQGTIDRFFSLLRESGRNPDDFGVQTTFPFSGDPDDWRAHVERAASWGANHLSVNTMGIGLGGPREHIAKIEEIRRAIE